MATSMTGNANAAASVTFPAYTTLQNNELVFALFGSRANSTGIWSSAPAITQDISAWGNNSTFNLWVGHQTAATAGLVAAVTGTLNQGPQWSSWTLAVFGTSGNLPTVGNTTSALGSGTTVVVTKPAGVATGDMLLACFAWPFNALPGVVSPTAYPFTVLFTKSSSTNLALTCMYRFAGASDPASYTFPNGGGAGSTEGGIVDIAGAAGFDNQFTSATASFTAADVGKLICVDLTALPITTLATAGAGHDETCGTIFSVTNGTTAILTMPNTSGGAVSNAEFHYATDDTAAFKAAIAALTKGGTIFVKPGIYGLTSTLTFPPNLGWVLEGSGGTLNNWVASGTYTSPQTNQTTVLNWLTTANTGPALKFNQTGANQVSQLNFSQIRDIGLYAGAGIHGDGSGADGIDLLGWAHLTIQRVSVSNFTGNGIFFGPPNPALGGSSWDIGIALDTDYIQVNGGHGISFDGATTIETILIQNTEVEGNQGNGFNATNTSSSLLGVDFIDDVFQWNDQINTAGGAEINLSIPCVGCAIVGDYFETINNAATYQILFNDSTDAVQRIPTVQGCYFFRNGGGTTGVQLGNAANHQAIGGMVVGNQFSANWTNCINVGGAKNVSINGNNCNGTEALTTSQSGSSGTAACTETASGTALTESCYLNGYAETGAAQTVTYPIPFITAPNINQNCVPYGATSTNTVLTLPANAAMTAQTCVLTVSGQ